jgi:hypothetical protein
MARAKRIKSEAEQEQTTEAREALTPISEPATEPEPPKPKNKGGRPRNVTPEVKETAAPSKPLTRKRMQAAKLAAKPEALKAEREEEPPATVESETPEAQEPPITPGAPSPLVTAVAEPAPPMEADEEIPLSVTEPEAGDAPAPPAMKATSRPNAGGVPMKPNPLYIETKSKRVQLMLQPSVYDGARKLAEADGLSFNEFVHRKLEEAIGRQDKML